MVLFAFIYFKMVSAKKWNFTSSMRCRRNYQWRQWQRLFVRRLEPREYNNTSWTQAVNRAAVFRGIHCKFVTYIVKLFCHDWVVSYTQSFCYSCLSLCSLLWLFVQMARVRDFDHIYVCISWPQVSQHLPSFSTLAVTGWHSNSYDIKYGTSQPGRIVLCGEKRIFIHQNVFITHTFWSLASATPCAGLATTRLCRNIISRLKHEWTFPWGR